MGGEPPATLLVNGLGRRDPEDSSLPWQVLTVDPALCSAYRSGYSHFLRS